MTWAKASNKPGTKAWRETLVEEAWEEIQVEEVEDNPHPLKDQLWTHNKSHNHKEMLEWWEHSWNPSLVITTKPETS